MDIEKIMQEIDVKYFISKLSDISFDIPTVYLLQLNIRSRPAKLKYKIKIKDMVVERKIIRPIPNWRQMYFEKLYNLAILQTSGKYYSKDICIASDCLGIMGTVNPRNVNSAIASLFTRSFEIIFQTKNRKQRRKELIKIKELDEEAEIDDNDLSEEELDEEELRETRNHYLSRFEVKYFGRLSKYAYRDQSNLVTVDIDDPSLYQRVRDMLSPMKIWMITHTSRGYHIILDLTNGAREFYQKNGGIWDQMAKQFNTKEKKMVELLQNSQEPIPGTLYFRSEGGTLNYVTIIE